jgi:hypothetical protein
LAIISALFTNDPSYENGGGKGGKGGEKERGKGKGKGRGKILIPGFRRSVRQYLRIYLEKGKVS